MAVVDKQLATRESPVLRPSRLLDFTSGWFDCRRRKLRTSDEQPALVSDQRVGILAHEVLELIDYRAKLDGDLPNRGVVDVSPVMDIDTFCLQLASCAVARLNRIVL